MNTIIPALPPKTNYIKLSPGMYWVPLWSSGSMLDHRSLPVCSNLGVGISEVVSSLNSLYHFITFGGHSAHLAYHVHKNMCT